jgi:hypothetical protein
MNIIETFSLNTTDFTGCGGILPLGGKGRNNSVALNEESPFYFFISKATGQSMIFRGRPL